MDRSAIFTHILARNALRREAKLPTLKVRAEYERLVEIARWREIVDAHYERVSDELLAQFREKTPGWGHSAGGRLALHLLTTKALRER